MELDNKAGRTYSENTLLIWTRTLDGLRVHTIANFILGCSMVQERIQLIENKLEMCREERLAKDGTQLERNR